MKIRSAEIFVSSVLVAALLVVCLNAWLALRSVQVLGRSQYWVSHTWQVMNALEHVISSMKDAETGNRGYLLTGDPAYLEPYTAALRELPAQIDDLQHLTADNPRQQVRFPDLHAVVDQRLNLLEQGIDERRAGNKDTLRLLVLSGTGKTEMDHLRAIVDSMQAEERRLLVERVGNANAARIRSLWTVSLASIFDVILLGIVFSLLTRERTERQRADATADQLSKLQSISDVGLTQLTVTTLSDALLERLRTVIDADAVVLCNWHTGEVEVIAGNGVAVTRGRRFPLRSGDLLEVAGRTNQLVTANGEAARAISLEGIHAEMQTCLILPLTISGRVAALVIACRRRDKGFEVEEEHLLSVAADRMAMALDRANAYESELLARRSAETSAREVQTLNAELEDRVRQRTAELEATNRELEAFSYSVSHDLRAPLRSIDGFSLALEEDFASSLNDEGRDYIRRIRSGVQRMGLLIDSLLQLSRITRADLTREEVNLSELAEEIARDLRAQSPGRNLIFRIEPEMKVSADPRLLRVALENLMGNAAKFTSKLPEAVVEVARDPRSREFYVRDNGAGFDMKYNKKLFTAFQRLHGEKDFSGSGIGLATVYRVIRRHQGAIHAEGAVDGGATFWFTLG